MTRRCRSVWESIVRTAMLMMLGRSAEGVSENEQATAPVSLVRESVASPVRAALLLLAFHVAATQRAAFEVQAESETVMRRSACVRVRALYDHCSRLDRDGEGVRGGWCGA
jgi:hypothetical protein